MRVVIFVYNYFPIFPSELSLSRPTNGNTNTLSRSRHSTATRGHMDWVCQEWKDTVGMHFPGPNKFTIVFVKFRGQTSQQRQRVLNAL